LKNFSLSVSQAVRPYGRNAEPFPFTERGGRASARCRVISATAGEVAAWVKTERTARKLYRTRDEAKADMFDYIERFYNPKREQGGISLSGCHPNRVQAMLTASTIGFFYESTQGKRLETTGLGTWDKTDRSLGAMSKQRSGARTICFVARDCYL